MTNPYEPPSETGDQPMEGNGNRKTKRFYTWTVWLSCFVGLIALEQYLDVMLFGILSITLISVFVAFEGIHALRNSDDKLR